MRYVFCLLIFCSTCFVVSAQNKNERWGYLRDSATREPIPHASVSNLNTKKTVMTSATGRFRIELSQNQVLSFAAVGYHFDTIHYNKEYLLQDTLQLDLAPLAHSLGNVTVTGRGWSSYQIDSMERRKDYFGDVNYKIPPFALSNTGAGLGFNLDHFSKREKAKRKRFEYFEENEDEAYINYRFSASLVNKYSNLKDEQLQLFMQQYRPSSDWLRKHATEEDLMYYINDKLKLFFKRQ
jgi:hypothetical protein